MIMEGASTAVGPDRALRIGDLMREAHATATPDTTADDARRLLREAPIGYLPVIEHGLLVGIVSDGDLRAAPRPSAPIATVMTRAVFVLSPETPLSDAARVFRQRGFGALPVLRGRQLCGMVSRDDVLTARTQV